MVTRNGELAAAIRSSGNAEVSFARAKKKVSRQGRDGRKFGWLISISIGIAGLAGWGIKAWVFEKRANEYYQVAQKLAQQKDWLAAVEGFQKAIRWGLPRRDAPRAGYLVATYCLPLKDYDKAIKWYRWVVRKYPDSPRAAEAQFMLAEVYRGCLGDRPAAIEEYKKFVELFPEHRLRADVERRILAGTKTLKPQMDTD